ncbi:MAG: hypothetical protein QG557_1179, partial [Pseudomonadota bacterium]|nr:hypothetical protein [Pseudomonadota bacterium]
MTRPAAPSFFQQYAPSMGLLVLVWLSMSVL